LVTFQIFISVKESSLQQNNIFKKLEVSQQVIHFTSTWQFVGQEALLHSCGCGKAQCIPLSSFP